MNSSAPQAAASTLKKHSYEAAVICVGIVVSAYALAAAPPFALLPMSAAAIMCAIAINVIIRLRPEVSVSALQFILLALVTSASRGSAISVLVAGGFASILDYKTLRSRPSVAPFNAAMFSLASLGAFYVWRSSESVVGPLVAGLLTTVSWLALNIVIVLPAYAADVQMSKRRVWALMMPEVPTLIVFGVFGAISGYIVHSAGIVAFPIIGLPLLVLAAVFRASASLEQAHDATEKMFLNVLRIKDEYTYQHCLRVAKFTQYIVEKIDGTDETVALAYRAGLLHDVGKIHTPLKYLNKPGRLTPEEWKIVHQHSVVCRQMLGNISFLRPVIGAAADEYARFGQTDMDETAHLIEYAVTVADGFDAMTSTRPYRKALPFDEVVIELRRCAGTHPDAQFSPQCVEALIEALADRGERYGEGHEQDAIEFEVEPPKSGFGSASLGKLAPSDSKKPDSNNKAAEIRFGVGDEPRIPDRPVDHHRDESESVGNAGEHFLPADDEEERS